MFSGCSSLVKIYVTDPLQNDGVGFTNKKISNDKNMFNGCVSLEGGKGTTYNSAQIKKEYARVDGGENAPGYFSTR